MSEKVLGLSPSSSSPSSNTSIPASSSKPNSPLHSSSPPGVSQHNFTSYTSPSSRDKFSPSSTNSTSFFTPPTSSDHQTPSSTLLNSWSSKPLGSHNFRNSTNHNSSNSSSSFSGAISTSFDTLTTTKSKSLSLTESCDNINKSKRKREEWTHVNNIVDDNNSTSGVKRYIKVNNRQAKRLMREQKSKRCIVKIGQKIENQLPVSELINLRENRRVNLVNLTETVSPINRKLSLFCSSSSSSSSKGNIYNSNTSSHTPPPTRQTISGSDPKRVFESSKYIKVGGGSSSTQYSDQTHHTTTGYDENHASSRKVKPNRYIGPKSRRGSRSSDYGERIAQNKGSNNNLDKEMTAEDKYDALVGRASLPKANSGEDTPNSQRSTSAAHQQFYQKCENGKDVMPDTFSVDKHDERSLSNKERERIAREIDYFSDRSTDVRDRSYKPTVSDCKTSTVNTGSPSNIRGNEDSHKLGTLREKLDHFINPLKIGNLSSLKQSSSNHWGSHPTSERKSLEKSIEKLKFPSSRENSNEGSITKSNLCSIRPENSPSLSSVSSSHLTSPTLAAAAAIAASSGANNSLNPATSSYTPSFQTIRSTTRPSSAFPETRTSSLSPPSSPKSSALTNTTSLTDAINDPTNSNMMDCGQQPSIVATYSLKSFEDAPEGENLREDNGWTLQPISPPNNERIDDSYSRTSLHQRFFPQKYEEQNPNTTDCESTNNDHRINEAGGVGDYGKENKQ